jgi:superfamily II DNA helicase RecQ
MKMIKITQLSNFRPQYLQLGFLKEKLTGVPCIALTATATPNVVVDIYK